MNIEIEVTQTWISNLVASGFQGPDLQALQDLAPEKHHIEAATSYVKARYRMINPAKMIEKVAKLYAQSEALHSIGVGVEQMGLANDYWDRVGPRGNVDPSRKIVGFLTRSGIVVEGDQTPNTEEDKVTKPKTPSIESSRFTIVQSGPKFCVFLDGEDTGRYGLSREKAAEIIARKAKSGKVAISQAPKAEAPKAEPTKPSKADKAKPANSRAEEMARVLKAAGFSAAEVIAAIANL